MRIVCQFSCGAASAVATKLALAQHGDKCVIVNAYLKNEHPDNRRFLADCERWFGRTVTVLRDEKFGADIVQVFRRKRFMKGLAGAPCSRELKRKLLDKWRQPGDVMVFGYTAEEADRLDDFRERNPDRPVLAPLIDAGLARMDPIGLGLETDPLGRPLSHSGRSSGGLWVIGSLRRPALWETTAVPELRAQAESTARDCMKSLA